jgi:hypothetical protein
MQPGGCGKVAAALMAAAAILLFATGGISV